MHDLDAVVRRLTGSEPAEILRWALDRFGDRVASSSSFQTQSLPLLHMISRVAPGIPVFFVDTGYHFPETLEFRDRIVDEWNLDLRTVRASDQTRTRAGDDLFRRNPDRCCHINKVRPMQRAMEGFEAWISGVRRDQTAARASLEVVVERGSGPLRVHPLLTWSPDDVRRYRIRHDLPEHPLTAEGYRSIGCAPCTRPVRLGEDARSGRWSGTGKTECGLHLPMFRPSTGEADAAAG